MARVNVRFLGR